MEEANETVDKELSAKESASDPVEDEGVSEDMLERVLPELDAARPLLPKDESEKCESRPPSFFF